jgi:hypothetical protein
MAPEGELEKENVVHKRGYEGFVTLMKWGTILSFLTAMLVVFIVAD